MSALYDRTKHGPATDSATLSLDDMTIAFPDRIVKIKWLIDANGKKTKDKNKAVAVIAGPLPGRGFFHIDLTDIEQASPIH